jgi:hypothetical protein
MVDSCSSTCPRVSQYVWLQKVLIWCPCQLCSYIFYLCFNIMCIYIFIKFHYQLGSCYSSTMCISVDDSLLLCIWTDAANEGASPHLLHFSELYNMSLDHVDLLREYYVWQSSPHRFSYCQFPFMLSLAAKRYILTKVRHINIYKTPVVILLYSQS